MSFLKGAAKKILGPAVHRVRQEFKNLERSQIAWDEKIWDSQQFGTGLLLEQGNRANPPKTAYDARYSVYSQFGEDGIIQYLLHRIDPVPETFVEIGVEDYRQSNTRFLLQKDNWRGLTIDASNAAADYMASSNLRAWRTIDHEAAFVDTDNINGLIGKHYQGEVGMLSIDVDGVDIYLWQAISVINPVLVVIEYQPNFGPTEKIATPYAPDFDRFRHHYSGQCAGASLAALEEVGSRLGYALVATSDGPNAFFVRRDRLNGLEPQTAKQAYRPGRYRDSRDSNFNPTFVTEIADRQANMRDAIVVDLSTGNQTTIGKVFGV